MILAEVVVHAQSHVVTIAFISVLHKRCDVMCCPIVEQMMRIKPRCGIILLVNMLIKQVQGKLLTIQKQGSVLVKCWFMALRPYSTKLSLQWSCIVTPMFQSYVYYCSTRLKLSRGVVIYLYFVYLTWW